MEAHNRTIKLLDRAKELGLINPVTGEGAPSVEMLEEEFEYAKSDGFTDGYMEAALDCSNNRFKKLDLKQRREILLALGFYVVEGQSRKKDKSLVWLIWGAWRCKEDAERYRDGFIEVTDESWVRMFSPT